MRKVEYLTSKFGKIFSYLETSITEGRSFLGFTPASSNSVVQRRECEEFGGEIKQHESGAHHKQRRSDRTGERIVSQQVTDELLLKCLRTIPRQYFINQPPAPRMINRDRRKTQEQQERMAYFLNQVDICIFNQVNLKFDRFLGVLTTIDTMDDLIERNVDKLRVVRQNNRLLHHKIVEKSEKVRKLAIRQANLRRLVEEVKRIGLYQKARTAVKGELNHPQGNAEAISLLGKLGQARPEFLKLKCTKNFQPTIKALETALVDRFSRQFADNLLDQLTSQLNFSEEANFWGRMNILAKTEKQLQSDKVLDDEIFDEVPKDSTVAEPQFNEQLFELVVQFAGCCQLDIQPTNNKINMHTNSQFGNFLFQLKNFCVAQLQGRLSSPKSESLETLLASMSLSFCDRAILFYSERSKGFLRRLLGTISKLIAKLKQHPIDLRGLPNRLFEIIQLGTELTAENIVRLFNLRVLEWTLDIQQFLDHIEILQQWECFVGEQVLASLKRSFKVERDRVDWIEAIKLNVLRACYTQTVGRFMANLHKSSIGSELKEAMENEKWVCIHIPVDLYISLSKLLGFPQKSQPLPKPRMLEGSFYAQKPSFRRDRSGIIKEEELKGGENYHRHIKIVKDECLVEGHRFKMTQTFLLLLQIMEEYLELGQRCEYLKDDISTKLSELVRFYNSQSCQLILGAGATKLGKLGQKNVTSRHLCVCAVTLEMLMFLVARIHERYPIANHQKLLEGIKDHHCQIIDKLKRLLQERIHNCISDVDMKTHPSKGTMDIVSSVRTLYDIADEYLSVSSLTKIFDWDIFGRYLVRIQKLNQHCSANILRPEVVYYFNELQFLLRVIPDLTERRKSVYNTLGITTA